MTTAARRRGELTLEEWATLDEDEGGELVDGLLEEEEMPTFLHEFVVQWLLFALQTWAKPRGACAFGSEAKFAVGARRGRKADISLYRRRADLPEARASIAKKPPAIVVEVLSPRPRDERRDRIDKAKDYARFGVSSYWIVNPLARIFEVRSLEAGGYVTAVEASQGVVHIPAFEALEIDLDALWRDVDDAFPQTAEQ